MLVLRSQAVVVALVASSVVGCSGGAATGPDPADDTPVADGGTTPAPSTSPLADAAVLGLDAAPGDAALALRTTTVAAETANNTSAASSFAGLGDGDLRAGNVSKLSIHTLAPAGFAGKIFAHYMPWWGGSGHLDIGYSAKDPAQIARTVADMGSRGYDGVVLAEANTTGYDEEAAMLFATAADGAGLAFIASENHLDSASDPQSRLTGDLAYFEAHVFGLEHYFRIGGQPVVMVFDDNPAVDWARASSASPSHPIFLYRNTGALTDPSFSGGFSWFGSFTSSDPLGLSYLAGFYAAASAHPSAIAGGDLWKGFDDRLASWTQDRVIEQHCGTTWLQTAAKLPASLSLVQVATWNDYEEGTEVESGIDNCASISASYSAVGGTLSFAPSFSSSDGSETTVDHYEVFTSADAVNLRQIARLPAGARSLALGGLGLPAGETQLFVEMVGKSHIVNHLSAAVAATIGGCPSPASPAPSTAGDRSHLRARRPAPGPRTDRARRLACAGPDSAR